MVDQILNATNIVTTAATVQSNYAVKTVDSHVLGDPLTLSHVGDGIFLQSKTAQVLAGASVWIALFITCQQVKLMHIIFFYFIFSLFIRTYIHLHTISKVVIHFYGF